MDQARGRPGTAPHGELTVLTALAARVVLFEPGRTVATLRFGVMGPAEQ